MSAVAFKGASTSSAQRTVVASVLVTGSLVGVASIAHGKAPSIKAGVGLAFAAVVLAVAAGPAPGLASAFAALLMVGAVISTGGQVFTLIAKGVSP